MNAPMQRRRVLLVDVVEMKRDVNRRRRSHRIGEVSAAVRALTRVHARIMITCAIASVSVWVMVRSDLTTWSRSA
jgi:hypothetical protein